MKKIAFITHSFHQFTKSANVYVEEIFGDTNEFDVDIFYNYEWGSKDQFKKFDETIEHYDAVIILQLISFNLLKNIKCKNIIFMPMYDYSRNFSIQNWLPSANLKILTPVSAMSNKLNSIGLSSYEFKYFPEVSEYEMPNFNNVYFWNRVDKIDYKTVLELLSDYKFSSLNIHKPSDPGNKPPVPSNKEIKKYKITFTDWYDSKDDYIKNLGKYGIYIAPRPFEGGAAAFVDALKIGCIVIAPNLPPFNEYIEDKKNGFLYNMHDPTSLQLNQYDLEKISLSAYDSVKQGRKDFESSLSHIHEFIFNKEENLHPLSYFEHIEKAFENPWFRFGTLTRKDKIKVIFKFVFSKFKSNY